MVYVDFVEFGVRWRTGMVALSGQPVLSVFYLVAVFFGCSVLRIFHGVEFLGLMLVVIYMGAIAVLFLFVVMMLEIKVYGNATDYTGYLYPTSLFFSLSLLALSLRDASASNSSGTILPDQQTGSLFVGTMDGLQGTAVLSSLLYTHYWHFYLIAGVVLLVALIGASVLTRSSNTPDSI